MPITVSDESRLKEIFAEYRPSYEGRKEDYFGLLYLSRKFKEDPRTIAHQICFGNNDYGIDGYYVDREAKNLYLYQFKWSEKAEEFKGSMERLAKDGLRRIFGDSGQDPDQNDVLTYLKKDLKEHRELIRRVYLHFVFKGDVDAIEKSEGLRNRREDLENKQHLVREYFGDHEVELQVDFVSDKPGRRGPPPSQSYTIAIRQCGAASTDGHQMRVGFVRLMDLYRIYKALNQQFFDRNIRAALPADNAPNKKLREALDRIVLKEVEDPAVFVFRHNGVTLAAERVCQSDGEITLYVPRLLNGAQTISSVERFLNQHSDNALLKKNRARLDEVEVLAKIVEDDPSGDFVTQVTISNNQQNPVPPWALRAMDQRQVDLADKFRDDLGIFYSRQEGAFEALSDEEREELEIEDSRDLRIRPLAQTFLALQGDVYNMTNLSEVFDSQKLYEATFRSTFLTADSRKIVLAYKVGLMMGRVTAKLKEVMPAKYAVAIPKARNLIWALLIQALFNDGRRLEQFAERCGASLVRDATFGDALKQAATTKIQPLLRDLMATPAYKPKVEVSKYDFLRSTEAFRKAMDIAGDKFGWSKKSV